MDQHTVLADEVGVVISDSEIVGGVGPVMLSITMRRSRTSASRGSSSCV